MVTHPRRDAAKEAKEAKDLASSSAKVCVDIARRKCIELAGLPEIKKEAAAMAAQAAVDSANCLWKIISFAES